MNRRLTRRDTFKLMGTAALGSGFIGTGPVSAAVRPRRADRDADMRGIFVILSTPYTESGVVDYEDLAFQVEWLDHAGVHGLVWPQNSSDYPRLTTDEIQRGMRVLTDANRGRSMSLVLGVQQDSTAELVEQARFAERLEPDMMIAMPPKVGSSLTDYRSYYSALAGVTERPVMIQTQPNLPGLQFETDLILELADRFPQLGYVKEEAQPVFDRIEALVGRPEIQRVYSAMRGRYFAYDLRLGVDGLVSGMSMYAEVFVRMWEAKLAGDWDEVRDIHGRLLVMLTCEQEIPAAGRYLLQRRGIFKSRVQRGRGSDLSDIEVAEIEHNLRGLEPYLTEVPRRRG
jgi:4-hydroxy-tetrahydrodipicolinate synthase